MPRGKKTPRSLDQILGSMDEVFNSPTPDIKRLRTLFLELKRNIHPQQTTMPSIFSPFTQPDLGRIRRNTITSAIGRKFEAASPAAEGAGLIPTMMDGKIEG